MGISTLHDDCFSMEGLLNAPTRRIYAATSKTAKALIYIWSEGKLLPSSELPAAAEN
jgi:hypothetical protein